MRLARPLEKLIYKHLDLDNLEQALQKAAALGARRVLVITDGVFSMRGLHAPLAEIARLVEQYNERFAENAILIVDDSHGVGAFGATGRGTEEYTAAQADVLIGTLGKAFGVNGGYVVGAADLIAYLRETSPMYIYSNPITPGEAAAAVAALKLVQAPEGQQRLKHLAAMTERFRQGLLSLGYESFPGAHPVFRCSCAMRPEPTAWWVFCENRGFWLLPLCTRWCPKARPLSGSRFLPSTPSGMWTRYWTFYRLPEPPEGLFQPV